MSSLFDLSRMRRKSWGRITLYLFTTLLAFHLLKTFITRPTPTLLPWYRQSHPSLRHLQPHYPISPISEAQAAIAPFAVEGIPGSVHTTSTLAENFRRQVDCWTNGTWVKPQHPHYIMPHFQDPIYGSCERRAQRSQSKNQAVDYVWQSKCDPQPVIDPTRWCQALRGRHILLVGDLVQYQLHEIFLDTLREGPTICFGELNCKNHTICDDLQSQIRYLRNDVLSVRKKIDPNEGHPRADVIEWPFTTPFLVKNFDVMILNRAPVLESDQEFIAGLVETLQTIRQLNPNSLIIYRSTGIGHPFCDEATGPLEKPLTDQELDELPYGWRDQRRRNAMARVMVEAVGGVFLDLAALTDLRPDGHLGGQDCLRYCIPGPLTGWAQVLFQVFLGLEGLI